MLQSKRPPEQIKSELEAFLQDQSQPFTEWLFKSLHETLGIDGAAFPTAKEEQVEKPQPPTQQALALRRQSLAALVHPVRPEPPPQSAPARVVQEATAGATSSAGSTVKHRRHADGEALLLRAVRDALQGQADSGGAVPPATTGGTRKRKAEKSTDKGEAKVQRVKRSSRNAAPAAVAGISAKTTTPNASCASAADLMPTLRGSVAVAAGAIAPAVSAPAQPAAGVQPAARAAATVPARGGSSPAATRTCGAALRRSRSRQRQRRRQRKLAGDVSAPVPEAAVPQPQATPAVPAQLSPADRKAVLTPNAQTAHEALEAAASSDRWHFRATPLPKQAAVTLLPAPRAMPPPGCFGDRPQRPFSAEPVSPFGPVAGRPALTLAPVPVPRPTMPTPAAPTRPPRHFHFKKWRVCRSNTVVRETEALDSPEVQVLQEGEIVEQTAPPFKLLNGIVRIQIRHPSSRAFPNAIGWVTLDATKAGGPKFFEPGPEPMMRLGWSPRPTRPYAVPRSPVPASARPILPISSPGAGPPWRTYQNLVWTNKDGASAPAAAPAAAAIPAAAPPVAAPP
eukprot:TRINITY_DN42154_c0_g1_i1.p1 TRINITY_DN42154_c0_g1~~TRINITY_DN42154_c0_g1_i1.p1  ORF type:complete len:634 (+),score=100.96 TRINITY_DN42154_c0_g1_i1:206-1903(+)